jgi:carboxymethylenebutenolidase
MRGYMLRTKILYRSLAFLRLLGAVLIFVAPASQAWSEVAKPELITFMSGDLALKGFLWKPDGPGPFPAIVWNHGSEKRPGKVETVAPYFVSRGYVFFVPHRRGQGRSPGPYIMDQLNASGMQRSRMLVTLNEVHLHDQLAALDYLKHLPYVDPKRLVVMGASFGGIQTILAAERGAGYRAAVDCSGGAESWMRSQDLRVRLTTAARKSTIPVFFLQAANDYDLTPNRVLSAEVRKAGKFTENKIYPAFGSGAKGQEGHKFCSRGTDIWGPDVLKFIEANPKPG